MLEQYKDQFGATPYFADYTDRCLVAELLEQVIRERITRDIVATFSEASRKGEEETREWQEKRRLETRP
jgi:hypothetical protein